MAPISLLEPSGRYLSFVEREEIALLRAQDHGVREITRSVRDHPLLVSCLLPVSDGLLVGVRRR